ncbi:Rieske (2Fe-2S) protein [Sphingomonas sp. BT-65]|uniref:Rieske (2Fe-2S) protein n=1 Tax=Sphingomonas sp. BT-65 TaxID=2989821 RepID=UPI002236AAEC|nr:Rieske (2Fe-2S) protein [Sphingomonas sp. BT-65]MCW4460909.1 Rieske (2Fe-2S) protein [Sphingomonas sp. BT-65]
MSEPARLSSIPAGVALGPVTLVADGCARNFVIQTKAGRFHGFVVRRGEHVHGYVDRCPHAGLPLAQHLDEYLTQDARFIACSWHGALFDPTSGVCVGGPCVGLRLTPWPVAIIDREIRTIEKEDLPCT